ncbi:hypothetical protein P171DRAFT_478832 [Karstenula rhodostoma CBS 690.94]|uniref:Uncharacterized protein n=1 Tax=Karstenula rhodostoma CBS 690.94 TaxID=1392251 RepID=A0A9P4PUW4_9PLEO|nr:hypothetical protein P171DRAFT_478832 [Karstenula rhodostoma CBS 690.94]
MSDNSKTPRNKRLSNGPGASSADKYPEDSPTRLRHPPRFPAAMQNQRRRRAQPQQQVELRVDDTQAWPSLGEVSMQTRSQRRRAAHAARSSSASTSGSDTQQPPVSQQPDAATLSPEQRDLVEVQVEAYRQSLLQQHTPTRRMSVPERNLFQPRLAPYSAHQQSPAQQGSSQQYTHQHAEQPVREPRPEMASTGPLFASNMIAGVMAAQQQHQLTTQQQQQQALPFRAFGPGQNSAYNFDRLAASQQAERVATLAQLHSAFIEPQNTYAHSILTKNSGHESYGVKPGAYADYSSFQGSSAPTDAPAAVSRFSQPTTGGLNPSAQGFHPQPESSPSVNAPRGQITAAYPSVFDTEAGWNTQADPSIPASVPRRQINSAYLPVLDAAAGPSTHTEVPALHGQINPAILDTGADALSTPTNTRAPATEARTTEPAFTAADFETSPPPSPSQALPDLMSGSVHNSLDPDTRPLTLSQQSGTRYGIEIGGLGISTLGTSDRTNWLSSPWNQPGQQSNSRVRPLGWEWATQNDSGTRSDRN